MIERGWLASYLPLAAAMRASINSNWHAPREILGKAATSIGKLCLKQMDVSYTMKVFGVFILSVPLQFSIAADPEHGTCISTQEVYPAHEILPRRPPGSAPSRYGLFRPKMDPFPHLLLEDYRFQNARGHKPRPSGPHSCPLFRTIMECRSWTLIDLFGRAVNPAPNHGSIATISRLGQPYIACFLIHASRRGGTTLGTNDVEASRLWKFKWVQPSLYSWAVRLLAVPNSSHNLGQLKITVALTALLLTDASELGIVAQLPHLRQLARGHRDFHFCTRGFPNLLIVRICPWYTQPVSPRDLGSQLMAQLRWQRRLCHAMRPGYLSTLHAAGHRTEPGRLALCLTGAGSFPGYLMSGGIWVFGVLKPLSLKHFRSIWAVEARLRGSTIAISPIGLARTHQLAMFTIAVSASWWLRKTLALARKLSSSSTHNIVTKSDHTSHFGRLDAAALNSASV